MGRKTDKVPGQTHLESLMLGIGEITKPMGRAYMFGQLEINTKETGLNFLNMAMGLTISPMGINIVVNTDMVNHGEEGDMSGHQGLFMKESLKMVTSMVKVVGKKSN